MDWMERGLTRVREHSVIVNLTQPFILERSGMTIIFCDGKFTTTRGKQRAQSKNLRSNSAGCTWKMTGVDFYGAKLSPYTKGY